jgi:hypothetical protein
MAIYRGPGGAGDATADATNAASVAEGFADDAAVSAAAATSSAADALTAQTAAEAAQTAAEAAQTAAELAETNAETAETNAETAQTAAEAARDEALSHAGNAESFADAAEISAGNAETSYQNTLAIFGNAEDVAAAVLAAETSAGNAEAFSIVAFNHAGNAEDFATAAEVSAGNAEAFSITASGYADLALSHAGNAEDFATAAATSASNAATTYDAFDDRYLGSKASAPATDNDGNTLLTGALYWNSSANQLYVWDGAAWDEAAFNATGAVVSFNTRSGAVTLTSTDVTDALTYTPLGSADIGVTVQAYDATYLVDADIGVTVQGYDIDTAKLDVAQTFSAQQTFTEVKDTVHTISDGAGFEIDPANGSIQVVTLGDDRTPAATNFEAGQVVLLGIDDGTDYTVTWTTVAVTWVKAGGTSEAPTLATTGYTWVLLWKVGSTIYGTEVGQP